MKTIFLIPFIIATFIFYNTSFGQNTIKDGEYIKNDMINKFVGTWQWKSTDGDTVFIIDLIKVKITLKDDKGGTLHSDVLEGWHQLIIRGCIVESSFSKEKSLTYGTQGKKGGANINFHDLTKSKTGKAYFDLLSTSKDQLHWVLKNLQNIYLTSKPGVPVDLTFTVPTNIIFTRLHEKEK